jgi:secretion/DNA translocation related TadE-like protein
MSSSPRTPPAARGLGSERGAATLIALALVAVVVMAALVTADIGALAVARAQAQTAADLAALAAVTPAGGGPALARAGEIAAANGARMTRCSCEPMEAVVSVRRRVRLAPFGRVVEVRADARAILPANGTQVAALGPPRSRSADSRPGPTAFAA